MRANNERDRDDATQRIVVTGLGLVSAAGCNLNALGLTLSRGQACLNPIARFDATGMAMTHAGEIPDFDPLCVVTPLRARTIDRGSQLALAAANQALAQAEGQSRLTREETGIAVGLSGAHQYQNLPVTPDRTYPVNRRVALYGARSTPAFQADLLARTYSLAGPRIAFGSASLGGLLAVAHAMDLLRAGHAQAMLVGGGEVQTLINALGMDSLGLGAKGPCSPFRESAGMSFGEGAAFLVLETAANAEGRDARPLAELMGWGANADAYNEIGNDPTGQGLARAIRQAFIQAGQGHASVSWIRTCGTGHRTQDSAERVALLECFASYPPPVTSTEPYFGHVNGVSPLLGLLAGIATQETGRALAMPGSEADMPATGLYFLKAGVAPKGDWLLTATAFGGTNGALVVGPVKARMVRTRAAEDIVIGGLGVVSAFGYGVDSFLAGLGQRIVGGRASCRVDESALPQSLPGLDLRRRERIVRWSLLATAQALNDAGLARQGSDRIGILVGLVRGPLVPYERVFERILKGELNASIGRGMLKMSRFTVASEVAHALGLKGYCATICPGVHGGVQLLAHGAELMAGALQLDALIVLAADEWTGLLEGMYDKLSLLHAEGRPYDPASKGTVGGEGAAAVLLARRSTAGRSWAKIAGCGFSGDTGIKPEVSGRAFARAISTSLARADLNAKDIDFALGQGCGWAPYDARELAAVQRIRKDLTIESVLGHTGVAESAGGLFSAVTAAAALHRGELPNLPSSASPEAARGSERTRPLNHALLIGSSERGANAALLLKKAA